MKQLCCSTVTFAFVIIDNKAIACSFTVSLFWYQIHRSRPETVKVWWLFDISGRKKVLNCVLEELSLKLRCRNETHVWILALLLQINLWFSFLYQCVEKLSINKQVLHEFLKLNFGIWGMLQSWNSVAGRKCIRVYSSCFDMIRGMVT